MRHYANGGAPARAPTEAEVLELLRVSGQQKKGLRDHVILGLAVGAGLRELEIAHLDIADVSLDGHSARLRVLLRRWKGSLRRSQGSKPGTPAGVQEVPLSERLRYKLELYLGTLPAGPLDRPLFTSQKGGRISRRRLREIGEKWQRLAGFERPYRFHDLRHFFCNQVRIESRGDVAQVRALARHQRIETTLRYMHPTEDELRRTLKKLPG